MAAAASTQADCVSCSSCSCCCSCFSCCCSAFWFFVRPCSCPSYYRPVWSLVRWFLRLTRARCRAQENAAAEEPRPMARRKRGPRLSDNALVSLCFPLPLPLNTCQLSLCQVFQCEKEPSVGKLDLPNSALVSADSQGTVQSPRRSAGTPTRGPTPMRRRTRGRLRGWRCWAGLGRWRAANLRTASPLSCQKPCQIGRRCSSIDRALASRPAGRDRDPDDAQRRADRHLAVSSLSWSLPWSLLSPSPSVRSWPFKAACSSALLFFCSSAASLLLATAARHCC